MEKSAAEKAGIIKEHVPVVIGESRAETVGVFQAKAQEKHAEIYFAEDTPAIQRIEIREDGTKVYHTGEYGTLVGELKGDYQDKNTNTILQAISLLTDFKITMENAQEGFAHVVELTGIKGRWQVMNKYPFVVCDTGHNADAWKYLSKQIARQPYECKRVVFGMVDDKDIDTVMSMLPADVCYYFTQASTKRAIPVEKVAAIGKKYGLQGKEFRTVERAFCAACDASGHDDFIFVGGSSYVVADLLSCHNIPISL